MMDREVFLDSKNETWRQVNNKILKNTIEI